MPGIAAAVAAALDTAVVSTAPLGGGCVSDARKVVLADERVIVAKSAAATEDPAMLAVEAEGLRWLAVDGGVPVPEVVALTDEVLVLPWIAPGRPVAGTDDALGRGLAALHRSGAARFGWHRDGFIGTLAQRNTPQADDWPAFWMTRRIEPLARAARARGAVDDAVPRLVTRLADRIADLAGPPEPPARLHGDLWSGNVHVDARGTAWVIDPAAYGGHREVDLAMLHLFGAPSPALTAAYDEVHPLAGGWRERLHLWQLEPLLTHATMFGGGYGASVRARLDRFAGRPA